MKIIETRQWMAEDVREICIENNLYTKGTTAEYDNMLNDVSRLYPGNDAIYKIAKDILAHSDEEQIITNIMFLLMNKAVKTFFEIVE